MPLVIAIRRVHRMRRAGLRWPEGQAALDALAARTESARHVAVFLHPHLHAPMTCGVRRPAIGLPADAVEWPLADLQRALVHELEHVRRMDWAAHILARAACAAYWFHPLAWTAWRRLCLESERACDDAVVRQADGAAYAQQLLWLARRLSNRPVPMLSMAAPSSLSTRVRAVLDTAQARGRAGALPLVVIAAGAMTLVTAISPLQATPRPQSSSPASMPADPALRFPVASVRPADPSDRSRGFGYTLETGRLNLRNQTLRTMIGVAFSEPFGLFFPDERISGGPEWLNDERFTIQARAERPVSNAEMGALLRALLRDRFALRVRTETREQPIYALVIARTERGLGPELRPAVKDCAAGGRCGIGGAAGRYELTGATMPLLAALLGEALGRPVVDRTGLDGSFEGRLTFAPPLEAGGALGEPASGAAAADPGPSIFTALEEQFGLELQSERGPVEYLVIESADRPTPNDAPETPAREAAGTAPQAGAAGASFDVASIRRNTSNEALVRGVEIQPGGRVVALNTPVSFLIAAAYGIPIGRLEGGPSWMQVDRYDLDARGEPAASQDVVRARLRSLLAERFALAAHAETRERRIYLLSRATGGAIARPGLRASGPECADIRAPAHVPAPPPAPPGPAGGATPLTLPGSEAPRCPRMFFPGFIAARQITLADLAGSLGNFVRRPVHDRTGLAGSFDVDLTFSMDGGPPGARPPAADGHAPSIFAAVQEQLGLKLEPAVGPVTVLVVDRIQRPTEN
jgi:uncharacterized protein (TIGR03435 family)